MVGQRMGHCRRLTSESTDFAFESASASKSASAFSDPDLESTVAILDVINNTNADVFPISLTAISVSMTIGLASPYPHLLLISSQTSTRTTVYDRPCTQGRPG